MTKSELQALVEALAIGLDQLAHVAHELLLAVDDLPDPADAADYDGKLGDHV